MHVYMCKGIYIVVCMHVLPSQLSIQAGRARLGIILRLQVGSRVAISLFMVLTTLWLASPEVSGPNLLMFSIIPGFRVCRLGFRANKEGRDFRCGMRRDAGT